ncbi:uncharacterized protein LOC132259145 [Phlebotomus argentipes]|uniref:uncharacterized protein LOC132259145 n=1 Tax=Phlebotomus argentipes TaxID=94469 RepID=UPI002892CC52|nr:uncharacterized protein LOC132259145 [Phlebotomus argentipes]
MLKIPQSERFCPFLGQLSQSEGVFRACLVSEMAIFACIVALLILFCWIDSRRPRGFPPGPPWLPIVGNFPLLFRLKKSLSHHHMIWQHLSVQYGSVVGLRLGRDRVIVVSGCEAIREFYNRAEFDGRPDGFFFRVRSFDQRLGLVFTDGQAWETQRRFCMKTLKQLGFGRFSMVQRIEQEAEAMVEHLWRKNQRDGGIFMHNAFDICVLNVLWTLMAGKRFDLEDKRLTVLMKLIHESFRIIDMSGGILNQYPAIRHILPNLSGYRPLVEAFKPLWSFLRETIEEIQLGKEEFSEPKSLIDAYVRQITSSHNSATTFTEEQLLSLCLDMFQAGSETTSNTLAFSLIYMLHYPEVAKRVTEELRTVVGSGFPKLQHRPHLSYTEAVLCEIMRCVNVAPLAIVHRALETVKFMGFTVPKGTLALVSLYSLHMDEKAWERPREFLPERFLDENGVLINHEGFLPFGSGKRRCMGENLAKSSLFVFFATFMHAFEMELPEDAEHLPDLEGVDGITLSPKAYKIILSRRVVASKIARASRDRHSEFAYLARSVGSDTEPPRRCPKELTAERRALQCDLRNTNIAMDGTLMLLVLLLCLLVGLLLLREFWRPRNFPPGPQWLPFVGNSPQIRREARKLGGLHRVYDQWTKDYSSPVLGMKMGGNFYVVGSSHAIVRDIHMREEFEGRPKNFFMRLRTMGSLRGITCVDGAMWAEHRAFTVKHLRNAGYGRQPMEVLIEEELGDLLTLIESQGEKEGSFWPGKYLPVSVLNVLWTFTAGKRLGREDDRIERLLALLQQRSKAFDMSGGVLSSMPWVRFLAPEWSGYNLIRRFNEELKDLLMEAIERHHETYSEEKSSDDLIYAFIKEMRAQSGHTDSTFTDIQLSMVILDIFIAGSQTTSTTIDLALMMLLINPAIQEKISREISENAQKLHLNTLTAAQHGNFPFTEAYLMEIRRFFNVVPISGPRRATKETLLGGYTIPKNSTILINLHSVHMDEDFWGDPKVFRPERFLTEDGKICNVERLMPFGQGKRRCLGDTLARACIFTFFTGIVQRFKLSTRNEDEKPDVHLLPGITLSPKPYKVFFEKREKLSY